MPGGSKLLSGSPGPRVSENFLTTTNEKSDLTANNDKCTPDSVEFLAFCSKFGEGQLFVLKAMSGTCMAVDSHSSLLERKRKHLGHVQQATETGLAVVWPREVVVVDWKQNGIRGCIFRVPARVLSRYLFT